MFAFILRGKNCQDINETKWTLKKCFSSKQIQYINLETLNKTSVINLVEIKHFLCLQVLTSLKQF